MEYHIYIDETGAFEPVVFNNNGYSVGGVVIEEKNRNKVDTIIRELRNRLRREKPGLNNSNLFHHRELAQANENEVIEQFLNDTVPYLESMFRTIDRPVYELHPQHTYFVCLSAAVRYCVQQLMQKENLKRIHIWVAKRARNVLNGAAINDMSTYEELLRETIAKEISPQCKSVEVEYEIDFMHANESNCLQLADMILGAYNGQQYATVFEKLDAHKINMRTNYKALFMEGPQQFIEELRQNGDPSITLWHLLSMFHEKEEIAAIALGYLKEYGEILLASDGAMDIIREYYDRVFSKSTRYQNLPQLQNSLNQLERLLDQEITGISLKQKNRMKNLLQYYQLHCEAHIGKTCSEQSVYHRLAAITCDAEYAALTTFPERLLAALEAKLLYQQLLFHECKYQQVIDLLENDILEYEDTLERWRQTGHKDHLLARLYGTCGQARGFIACLEHNEDLRQKAIEDINHDIALLDPDTPEYYQGISYLFSLYWKAQNKEQALRKLLDRTKTNDLDEVVTAIVNSPAQQMQFEFLDYCRYMSMIENEGDKVFSGVTRHQQEKLLEKVRGLENNYPAILVKKWIAVLLWRKNRHEDAYAMIKDITPGKVETIVQIMETVIKTMACAINNDGINTEQELQDLKRKINTMSGWQAYMEHKFPKAGEQSVEKLAALLPYYYS